MSEVRLIDANALLVDVAHRNALDVIPGADFEKIWLYATVQRDMFELVKAAPTIDAVTVVHGRWVKSNKHIWRKTKSGKVDEFWYEYDYHNGPGCEVCGFSFCEHCDPDKWDDETCKDHYICSVCGRIEMKAELYCNCGARMDGGAE